MMDRSNTPMTTQVMAQTSYRVETSGWDADENFFVEKTDLDWTEEEKTIHLQHPVRKGALVFVRLIGIDSLENAFPVAYQAAAVTYCMELRQWDVSLLKVTPRTHAGMHSETSHN
jgi:hypothetical protein